MIIYNIKRHKDNDKTLVYIQNPPMKESKQNHAMMYMYSNVNTTS